MKITEEDILKFVFSKEKLDESTINYIKLNYNDYSEQIELLKEIYLEIEKEDPELTAGIELRFSGLMDIFELYPKIDHVTTNPEILTIAAASEKHNRIDTISFTDHDNQVVVRIIKENGEQRLYLFPLIETNKTYRVILYPAQEIVTITDLTTSYKIESDLITKIIVQVM